MLQPDQHLLPVLQVHYHLQLQRQAPIQALPPHCDPSSQNPRPSSTSRLHEYLQEDHRAQLQLPLAVEEHRLEVVEEHRHPLVASVEAEEVQNQVALEVVEEGRQHLASVGEEAPHCLALGEEEVPHCLALVEEVGSTSLALVAEEELRM